MTDDDRIFAMSFAVRDVEGGSHVTCKIHFDKAGSGKLDNRKVTRRKHDASLIQSFICMSTYLRALKNQPALGERIFSVSQLLARPRRLPMRRSEEPKKGRRHLLAFPILQLII